MSTQKQTAYSSYLLRLWRDNHAPSSWRASLESAQTGEIYHFASLEALFAFISQQIVPENRYHSKETDPR
jgi:hypothetical protein